MIKSKEIFTNQTEPKIVEIANKYNCENMTIQIDSKDSAGNPVNFQLRISGKANLKYPYQPMSAVSDNFNTYTDITNSGTYSVPIGGKTHIEIQLLSIGSGGKLSCFANLY